MSEPPALTLVLPAYNEAERIDPALDELFGYLRRRGERARDGAPGRRRSCPRPIEVLVVDDGSDGRHGRAGWRRDRRRVRADASTASTLRVLRVPHGGKGAAVRAGMLAATGDLVIFADADMATPPDQIPLLVEALATHDVALGSRIQPDGSDMRATQPGLPTTPRQGLPRRSPRIWVVGPVQDTQCGFKGFTRAAAQDLFEPAAGHEHRLRRRAHLPRAPARLPPGDRADPLVRQARLADARATGPRAARRVGPVPDPAHPSGQRPERRREPRT